jgi:hypothetical protein
MSFKDNFIQTSDDIQLTKIIFPGKVFDANDPKGLGRLRVRPEQSPNLQKQLDGTNFDEKKDIWTNKDPYMYLPLLPFYLYQTPLKDEYVHILYYDKNYTDGNRFYIQGPFSDPRYLVKETFESSQQQLSDGNQYKETDNIRNYTGSTGIFPEPGDNSFLGRGSTDVVLKPETVLIRAGKTNTSNLKIGQAPQRNQYRSFLQLSNFTKTLSEGEIEKLVKFEVVVKATKKILIWNVDNLENNSDQFNGSIGIYNVIPSSPLINTENFRLGSIKNLTIGTDYQGPIEEFKFKNASINFIQSLTNQVSQSLLTGNVQISGYTINSTENFKPENVFPFVVTPSKITYETGGEFTGATENPVRRDSRKHYNQIYNGIKINYDENIKGFFIVSDNKSGQPVIGSVYERVEVLNPSVVYSRNPTTYGIMGADKLYFLTHKTTGAPNGEVEILPDTLYGLNPEDFIGEGRIESKTYSVIRGEELIELLRKIVSYVKGHVHPISTQAPVPVASGNGQTTTEIDEILANAEITILNQNIRIN